MFKVEFRTCHVAGTCPGRTRVLGGPRPSWSRMNMGVASGPSARDAHATVKESSVSSFLVYFGFFLDLACSNRQAGGRLTAHGGPFESGCDSRALHRIHGRCLFVRPRGLMRFGPCPGA